jgi:SAM-dependent methyltransferase
VSKKHNILNIFSKKPREIEDGIYVFSEMQKKEYSWEDGCSNQLEEPHLVEFFAGQKYNLALEVGAGNGRCAAPLSRVCDDLVVLESSRDGLNQLIKRGLGNTIPVLSFDSELPFKSDTFDLVASITVIEHIPSDSSIGFLEEHFRVLRPGGHFIIRNDAWAYGIYERYIGFKNRSADPTHINMITPAALKKQLRQVGFEIISEAYFPFYRYTKLNLPLMDIFATKGNFLCRKPLCQ